MATPKRRDALARAEIDPLDPRAARVAALDALARRDHASGGLRRKLLDKGYDAAVVDPVIEQLIAERLLNDHRYVENFLAYHAGRGQGPMRVRAELRQLEVDATLIEDAVEAYPEWIAQLRKAREKKFGVEMPTLYADKQRQSRFLGYRGYTGAQIRVALGFDTQLDEDT